MFISFGHKLRGLSRVRFGFRVKGSTAWIMAILYVLLYMCWYLMLGTLWLMYGICYLLLYLPIKGIVKLCKKKRGDSGTSFNYTSRKRFHPFASVKTAEEKERERRREEFLQSKLQEAKEELESLSKIPVVISLEPRKRNIGYVDPVFSKVTVTGKYNEFVVFDTETTGLTPSRDRIIELAAIRFVDGVPTEKFETFVNPERPISPEVTSINHITDEMVADAPTISQILPAFEAFVGDSPLVAHNLTFDLKFMYYSGANLMERPRKYFDTFKIAQSILKKPQYKYDKELATWEKDYNSDYDVSNYKLGTLADYYNIPFPDSHRAAADAIVTGKLFLKLIDDKQTYWSKNT